MPDLHLTRLYAVSLAPGATREVPHAAGRMTLHCRVGKLWITHDGDPRDVVLDANQSHSVDRAERLTVHAMREAGLLEVQVDA